MLLETQFPFLAEKDHVVSLVGGGGKTTLLYAFARHCAAKGWRVLVSTTTHIRQPGRIMPQMKPFCGPLGGRTICRGRCPGRAGQADRPAAGTADPLDGTGGYCSSGSGRCKTAALQGPAAHEPVLLRESDIVLAVAGLSALGRPLREVCFRLEQACALLGAAPKRF